MKTMYEAPSLELLSLQSEEIMTASEELDIQFDFKELFEQNM